MRLRLNLRSRFLKVTFPAVFAAFAFVSGSFASCQESPTDHPADADQNAGGPIMSRVYDYLKMANSGKPVEYRPITQKERNHHYLDSMINPVWFAKAAASAGFNQWFDTPEEWEQGASGYGKRYADILGQYAIRQTAMFGFESLLHEDNRYFASGKKGFGPRVGYALSSGILARHPNGKRYPSVSLLMGFASGAYLSRSWQPPSTSSFGDAASSFGISVGCNIGFGVLKEFLPDILRPIVGKKP